MPPQAHVTGKTGDSPVNAPTTLIDWTTPVPRSPSCDHDKNSAADPTPADRTSDIPKLDPTVANDPGTFTATNPATAAAEDAAVRAHQQDHSGRNNRVIWLLILATFVVFLNETIMSVAIPRLVTDLHIDLSAAQWLTAAFMLTMAVIIPVTGFLLQRLPTRPVFILAMSLFSVGTLLAALAPGFEVLLTARIVQASGTAIMMPLMMMTIMTLVAPAHRGQMMGRVSIVISVAPAIGPTLGGLILTQLSWRFMFWLVFPIAIIMLLAGMKWVANVSETRSTPLDPLSVVLSALGFGGLVYGLSLIGESVGDSSGDRTPMIVSLTIGVISILIFVLRQIRLQRHDRALLDLRTFRSRNFSLSVGLMVLMMVALFGTVILLPIYIQNVLGLSALDSGLLTLPGGLAMGLLSPIVGRLFDQFGPRRLLLPGSIVVSAALWYFATLTENTSPWLILVAHLILSLGLALILTPLFTSALGSVEPRLYSHGSAIVGALDQLAGAAGTALFIAVVTARSAEIVKTGSTVLAAEAGGIRAAFTVGAIISLAAIIGSFLVRKPAEPDADSAPVRTGGNVRTGCCR
ncbi:MAG: MFS transporter [Candidatus Lumbricidophila eiseniae]|uniref:MFS transporter n=1 Tax=Candidatus Lumbricidiphila eiseniae TaxID=1969409 RepID=A0A2A6FQA6_9MICO|nr:MAG: MFS transporter [Candidatus Lumbricidophila eiseniae]